jgi:hypothetical protein
MSEDEATTARRQTGDHRYPPFSETATDVLCRPSPVVAGFACADNGDSTLVRGFEGSTHEEEGGMVVDHPKVRGVLVVEHSDKPGVKFGELVSPIVQTRSVE